MAITSTAKIFGVEGNEYGYSFIDQLPMPGTDTIKLVIPKIMGSLSGIGPDNNNADGMFDNDTACKPAYAKKVSRSEFLVVPLEKNGLWMAHLLFSNILGKPAILKGTKFRIHFINENIHQPTATTS